ncbi:DUF4292 domain-containing protein [Lutibacter sp. HS1-25]|uniref:DUF4292 domain-containing protein n=1 Tax=Lutibacter sp. HS1-25 TaxID=2485000 RepID=UPI0010129309|nr:DUF4292 domain-containing protein [Lutibacter sp. HS1-25]RXP64455.1 DUF4292 domain-containing protein [Lutibacter sp. HS1-25]
MRYKLLILIVVFLAITGCKSKKNATDTNAIEVVSAKKLINDHYAHAFDKKTLSANINAKYADTKASVSINIKLRLEKDKTIWMSATKMGFPIAKILITPKSVQYYEKLERTYFDGDFSLLSKWLGTELDFKKVQDLLVGQAVLNLKDEKYDVKISNNSYELRPRHANDLFAILFFMNRENYKLDKQEIRNPKKAQMLDISYPSYTEIEGEQFPKNIDIEVIDIDKKTLVNIEYKSVEFNNKLTFPFEIPSGYKKISLK